MTVISISISFWFILETRIRMNIWVEKDKGRKGWRMKDGGWWRWICSLKTHSQSAACFQQIFAQEAVWKSIMTGQKCWILLSLSHFKSVLSMLDQMDPWKCHFCSLAVFLSGSISTVKVRLVFFARNSLHDRHTGTWHSTILSIEFEGRKLLPASLTPFTSHLCYGWQINNWLCIICFWDCSLNVYHDGTQFHSFISIWSI